MQDDYKVRMRIEAEELGARIDKAEARLDNEADPTRYKLLDTQLRAMTSYYEALSARIRYEEGPVEPETKKRELIPGINENRLTCVDCDLEDVPETIRPHNADDPGYEYSKLLYKGEVIGYQIFDGTCDQAIEAYRSTYNAVGECIS